MKRIYIVRHGQTYINRYDKMQGWCDTPLTDEGIKGAKDAGKALSDIPFDIAISSDLKRASDTCDYIINENCTVMSCSISQRHFSGNNSMAFLKE